MKIIGDSWFSFEKNIYYISQSTLFSNAFEEKFVFYSAESKVKFQFFHQSEFFNLDEISYSVIYTFIHF